MDKKKRTAIIISAVVLVIAVCMIALVFLRDDEPVKAGETTTEATTEMAVNTDKPQATTEEKTENSTEETTEVTTETAASTEKPSEEGPTTEAPATEGTTSAPAKPESTTEAPKPKPESTTEAPKPKPESTTEAPKPKPEPTTTEEPKPEPAPSAPTTEEPKHEHSWVWVETKAAGKVWIVDKAAWTETIEHPAKYDYVPACACNYCDEIFTSYDALCAHQDSFAGIDSNHSCAGSRSSRLEVLVEEAWTETINHEEVGHWEETPAEGYYKCSCGATK